MRILIELEGPLLDVAGAYYEAHKSSTAAVGWSTLDQVTFWRLTRTGAPDAKLVPSARPGKCTQYRAEFEAQLRAAGFRELCALHAGSRDVMVSVARHGSLQVITLLPAGESTAALLGRERLMPPIEGVAELPSDPRARPGAIRELVRGERRAIVAASSETIIRAAREAEVLAVGLSNGPCTSARLHQAGADVVYAALGELASSLSSGAKDLIQAGLLPASLG